MLVNFQYWQCFFSIYNRKKEDCYDEVKTWDFIIKLEWHRCQLIIKYGQVVEFQLSCESLICVRMGSEGTRFKWEKVKFLRKNVYISRVKGNKNCHSVKGLQKLLRWINFLLHVIVQFQKITIEHLLNQIAKHYYSQESVNYLRHFDFFFSNWKFGVSSHLISIIIMIVVLIAQSPLVFSLTLPSNWASFSKSPLDCIQCLHRADAGRFLP